MEKTPEEKLTEVLESLDGRGARRQIADHGRSILRAVGHLFNFEAGRYISGFIGLVTLYVIGCFTMTDASLEMLMISYPRRHGQQFSIEQLKKHNRGLDRAFIAAVTVGTVWCILTFITGIALMRKLRAVLKVAQGRGHGVNNIFTRYFLPIIAFALTVVVTIAMVYRITCEDFEIIRSDLETGIGKAASLDEHFRTDVGRWLMSLHNVTRMPPHYTHLAGAFDSSVRSMWLHGEKLMSVAGGNNIVDALETCEAMSMFVPILMIVMFTVFTVGYIALLVTQLLKKRDNGWVGDEGLSLLMNEDGIPLNSRTDLYAMDTKMTVPGMTRGGTYFNNHQQRL